MNARANHPASSRKTYLIACVSVVLVLGFFVIYSCIAFDSLMSVDEIQYNNPNTFQVDYFLESCDLGNFPMENAKYIVVSKSPHKSDSRMYMVFDGDVTDWWDAFISNPNPEDSPMKLPCEHAFHYDAMKQISPFVRAYRLAMNDAGYSLLIVANVSSETLHQLAELGSVS